MRLASSALNNNAALLAPIFSGVLLLALLVSPTQSRTHRVHLFPKLRPGQTLSYYVTVHADKQVYTQSSVIVATPPDDAKLEAHTLLRLEILDLQPQRRRPAIKARVHFTTLNSSSPSLSTPSSPQPDPSQKIVEFALSPAGHIDTLQGLDALSPEQQQAFQEWLARFALTASFPASGAKLGQRWKSQQLEPSPSPIAGLHWIHQSTYMGDAPCHPLNITTDGDLLTSDADDTCAVILTTATLTQHSKPNNATPETFKLHELRTAGAAHATNRIISYISLKTGVLVRATEEAHQNMDVTIAKADRSNRVRYDVTAQSHCEVLLVSEPPR